MAQGIVIVLKFTNFTNNNEMFGNKPYERFKCVFEN